MDYRKHRPWIFSALAIAFCAVAFWYAMPRDKGNETPPPANEPAPANHDNTPPSIGPAPADNEISRSEPGNSAIEKQPEAEPEPEAETPDPQPGKEQPPQAPEHSVKELAALLKAAIRDKDVSVVKMYFPELQGRGADGVAAAAKLLDSMIRAFSDDATDYPRATPPVGWDTLADWLHLFTPELVGYVSTHAAPLGGAVEIFEQIHLMDWINHEERAKSAGVLLLTAAGDETVNSWVSYSAVNALQRLPGDAAADYATQFLDLAPREDTARSRYAAVWVLARHGSEADWARIEQLALKDPSPDVRGTANYHLLARGVTERGLLVVGLTDDGKGAAAGLKTGDVIKSVDGKDVDYLDEIPDIREGTLELLVFRHGAEVPIKMDAGEHGIDGRHVPPAFLK